MELVDELMRAFESTNGLDIRGNYNGCKIIELDIIVPIDLSVSIDKLLERVLHLGE